MSLGQKKGCFTAVVSSYDLRIDLLPNVEGMCLAEMC
jgi:hypothetical protein